MRQRHLAGAAGPAGGVHGPPASLLLHSLWPPEDRTPNTRLSLALDPHQTQKNIRLKFHGVPERPGSH